MKDEYIKLYLKLGVALEHFNTCNSMSQKWMIKSWQRWKL